ncbi:3-oxoadipate enol-lactonase [Alphaproteobacteria bacterium]|nr:3-oxoadipate enol-lactonase [Alphaproteobacteria bacterium]
MKTILANNISINYRIDLQRDKDPDAPVIMLSNSLLSSYAMWDDQIESLTEYFNVLRYDTRGHGGTDAPSSDYSIDIFVEDAVSLLNKLNIDKVHFIGLSMGGFIGQLFAAKYPERVVSLTLCDTACVMPPASLWDDRIKTAENSGVESLIEGTLGRWFTAPFCQTNPKDVQRITEMIRNTGVLGYVNCAKAIRDMDQRHILKDINVPTYIIVGEKDPACPVSASRVLNSGIPGSSLSVLKDAAHLPNIEKKREFNKALVSFLKNEALKS